MKRQMLILLFSGFFFCFANEVRSNELNNNQNGSEVTQKTTGQTTANEDYLPLLKDNKRWKDYYRTCYGSLGTYNDIICSPQDTVINNVTYKKKYKAYEPCDSNIHWEYHGAMREQDKKVYYMPQGEADLEMKPVSEYLLYDFALEVGDTMIVSEGHYTFPVELQSITTKTILGTPRRVFVFDRYNDIIEGIGSNINFLIPFIGITTCFGSQAELRSVEEDGVYIYGSNRDCIVDGLEENESEIHYAIRSVNPELIIDFAAGTFDQVDIIDMSAKTIDSKQVNGLEQVTFSTGKYEPGVYFVLLQGKDRREVARVVVTR